MDVVEILLRSGANLNVVDNRGERPLDIARKNQRIHHKEIEHLLLDKIHEINNYLFYAVQEGNIDKVNKAIDAGANINENQGGWTPLHWACKMGIVPIIEVLLINDADINSKDAWGYTPIFLCCRFGHGEATEFLLKSGADVNSIDNDGMTPLDFARKYDNDDIEDILLKYGAVGNVYKKSATKKNSAKTFWERITGKKTGGGKTKRKRCKKGSRRNKRTGRCRKTKKI